MVTLPPSMDDSIGLNSSYPSYRCFVFYLSLADLVRSSLGSAFAFDNTLRTKMVESGMHAMRPEIEFSSFSSSRKTEEEQLDFLEINQPHHDPGTYIYFSN